MRSAILRALAMSWVIETAVAPRSLHALDDQVVDDVGHDRVEAGGRLVEEDDLGLARRWRGPAPRASACRRRVRTGTARRSPARGRQRPVSATRHFARLFAASCRRSGSGRRRHFPRRVSESNRAPPWNSMPNLRMTRRAAAVVEVDVSSPSTGSSRASGAIRPRMHFSSTDLPVPEPPMMTSDSPGATSRSMPCSTFFGPKALVTPRNEILVFIGALIGRRTLR